MRLERLFTSIWHCHSLTLSFISMWHLLIAAAVAGSTGLAAKHFLRLSPTPSDTLPPLPQQTPPCDAVPTTPIQNADDFTVPENSHETAIESNDDTQNQVFTFNSSKSPRQSGSLSRPRNPTKTGRRGSKTGIRVAKVEIRSVTEAPSEHRNGRKRLTLSLKRRKTNSIAGKTVFSSSKGYIFLPFP